MVAKMGSKGLGKDRNGHISSDVPGVDTRSTRNTRSTEDQNKKGGIREHKETEGMWEEIRRHRRN
jgi:hypothetical protein